MLDLPVLRGIGWALLDFLWQGSALGIGAWIATLLLRRGSAATRYAVLAAALACAPLLFVAGVARHLATDDAPAAAPAPTPAGGGEALSVPASRLGSVRILAGDEGGPAPSVALLAVGWMVAVVILALRLAASWWRVGQVARRGFVASPDVERIRRCFDRARDRMGASARARLVCFEGLDGPAAIGVLRGVVLMPLAFSSGLTAQQVELLLAHELAHVRRADYLVNLVQCWIEVLLFFHPVIWWISARMRAERELACDDMVVAAYAAPAAYGEALAEAAMLFRRSVGTVGATSSPLIERLRRLFRGDHVVPSIRPRGRSMLAFIGALVVSLVLANAAVAQSLARTLLASESALTGYSIVSRQSHRNRDWSQSVLSEYRSDTAGRLLELRLGKRFTAVRFLALVPDSGDGIVELAAIQATSHGPRTWVLLQDSVRVAPTSEEADRLIDLFRRESGYDVGRHVRALVATGGVGAALDWTRTIGDYAGRVRALATTVREASTAEERVRLVREAVSAGQSAVDVAGVVRAALDASASTAERVALVQAAPGVRGEAELVSLLQYVARSYRPLEPALRAAIDSAALTIVSDEARGVVMRTVGAGQ